MEEMLSSAFEKSEIAQIGFCSREDQRMFIQVKSFHYLRRVQKKERQIVNDIERISSTL